jgi:class 3 adenylate cyclase/tetratricopeptide (TPR) repeat protein
MICPNCGTQNPDHAKFCMNCGHEMVQTCSNCKTKNPLQAKFCTNCGNAFAPLPPDVQEPADPKVLSPQIPDRVAQKLIAARDSQTMVGERRIVTMLFCDVKGSTNLAEQLDPEEWTGIMNEAFDHLIQPIYRYEGTLARLMGDGLLAFFGAPIAHEDDPARAVLSGLAILEGIRPFCEKIHKDWKMDFDVRVGIHTGPVVVGKVGSDLAVEYTAMGDAVNLASRMEQTASPGTIQISDATYQLVKDQFEIEPLGGMMVKGKSTPVKTYRVLSEQSSTRVYKQDASYQTPIVGRSEELAQLVAALDSTQAGRGNIVTLVGEAGIGKTRLLQELYAGWVKKSPFPEMWLSFRGLSYDKDLPYSLFRHQLREQFGISGADPEDHIVENLRSRGFQAQEDDVLEMVAPVLKNLLGGDTGTELSGMDPESFQREIYDRLYQFLEVNLRSEPIVLAVEDLQWADSASISLIEHFLDLSNQLPILFIFTFRPDRHTAAWEFNQKLENDFPHRMTHIELDALSSEESHTLASLLLDDAKIHDDLKLFLMEKSEGNPLYLEAITSTLVESKVILYDKTHDVWMLDSAHDSYSLPTSLQSLMTAQIDLLDPGSRGTLQVASIVGRTFPRSVLHELSAANGKLDSHLNELQRLGVIQETMHNPELEYSFRHELMRDAAYRTILRKKRANFHMLVGEAIEKLNQDRIPEEAHRIAHHYSKAGEDHRALKYYTIAGDSAFNLYAVEEAEALYRRAIEISAEDTELSSGQIIHLFTRYGRALEMNGKYDDAEALYNDMESIAGKRNDKALELEAVLSKATIYSTPTEKFDMELGQDYFQQAIMVAEELDDEKALAKATWLAMNHTVFSNGDPQEARKYGERSLKIARENNLSEQLAYTLQDIQRIYFVTGQSDIGWEYLEEARDLWRSLGNKAMLADNLINASSREYWSGRYDRAIEFSQEGLELSEEIGNLWGQSFSRFFPGMILLDRGEVSEGIESLNLSIEFAEPAGYALGKTMSLGGLAWGYASIGADDLAIEQVEQIIDLLGERSMAGFGLDFTGLAADLYLKRGNLKKGEELLARAEALLGPDQKGIYANFFGFITQTHIRLAFLEEDFENVIRIADDWINTSNKVGHRVFFADALHAKARAYFTQGHIEEAKTNLDLAKSEAEGLLARRVLWQILATESEILDQEGNLDGAGAARKEARKHLDFILDHIQEPALKLMFQELPNVRSILDQTS